MAGFGGAIKLTGESEYRRALSNINSSLKVTASEMKVVASEFGKSDTSTQALASRTEVLKKKQSELEQAISLTKQQLKAFREQQEKNLTSHKELEDKLTSERKKLEEIEKQYGKNSQEYKEQKKVVDELETAVAKSTKTNEQNQKTLDRTETSLNNLQTELNQTTKEQKELNEAAKKGGEAAEKASEGFTVMKGVLANLASQAISQAISGLKQLASNIYDTGSSFDAAMSQVGAVSGAAGDELDQLTEKAKQMGSTTKFTATEAAEAFNYMAMAGWKTEDMLNGIEGILNLAAAAGADLATTSDIVTDALTAMGYSAGDAGRLADVMAAASSNANTNVEMMGATFQYAASVAGSLGYSMEDVALATGLMANSGIKGEKAGTALRAVMQRLATDTGGAATAMHDMGVETVNADGTMRPLGEVMTDLRKKMANLTDEQKTATAKTIAGTEAMGGLLAIVNASEADYNKLSAAINGSAGAASKMAETMQDNVAGQMTILKSQIEGIYLTIWKKLEPAISKAINSISKSLSSVNWDQFGKKAGDALNKVLDVFQWLLNNYKTVVNGIKAIIAAFVVTKVVNFTTSILSTVTALGSAIKAADGFSAAIGGIGKAVSTNPVGLLIGVLAGVGTAIYGVVKSLNEAEEEVDDFADRLESQTETINSNKDSWESLKKAQQEELDTSMTQLSHVEQLKDELLTLVDANGKVKEGYEGRASFILGQLNDALGTEYEMTDGIIGKYGELVESIDGVIEKKKAEAILNAQQAAYEEAINKQAEAYKNLNQIEADYNAKKEEYNHWQEVYNELLRNGVSASNEYMVSIKGKMQQLDDETSNLETNYQTQLGLLDEYAYNIGVYEQNMSLAHEGRYDEMSTATWNYVKDLQDAGDQQKAILEEDIKTTDTQIKHLEKLWKDTGDQTYKTQLDAAKKQQEANKQKLKDYTSTTESGLKDTELVWDDSLDKQISAITGSKVEFKDAGDGLVSMYIDGMKVSEPKTKTEITKMMNDQIKEMRNKNPEANTAGQNFIDGVKNGVSNQSKQSGVFSAIQSFGNKLLNNLRASLKEHSPSKATQEMGEYLLQGLGIGMDDESTSILRQAASFGESVINAMNGGLSAGVSTSAISDIKNAIPEDFSANFKANTTSSIANAKAENEYNSMVSAFKDALSQMKIEMDDQEMGSFIDKTVSRKIFS